MTSAPEPPDAVIAGLSAANSQTILARLAQHPDLDAVVLYGSRALGRHRPGSDIDLCLEAPEMGLAELLVLGAQLDDLLLPWPIDLQLRHVIEHQPLLDHIDRVGLRLWCRPD